MLSANSNRQPLVNLRDLDTEAAPHQLKINTKQQVVVSSSAN